MIIKLFSISKYANPDVNGGVNQVCSQDDHKELLINVIKAGNVVMICGTNLKGSMTYLFAPRIRKSLKGAPVEIVGNSSNVQEESSLLYISLDALFYFVFIEATDASLSGICATEPHFLSHLADTKWTDHCDAHVFLFSFTTPIL